MIASAISGASFSMIATNAIILRSREHPIEEVVHRACCEPTLVTLRFDHHSQRNCRDRDSVRLMKVELPIDLMVGAPKSCREEPGG
jgi:hypothetical protein